MKIVVGIMAIGLSLLVLFQATIMMGLVGPDSLEITDDDVSRGVMYLLLAIFLFVGAAFSFGIPLVAGIIFFSGFLFTRSLIFEGDIQVWGNVSLAFAVLLLFSVVIDARRSSRKTR